jgi:hypothetical protein
MNFNTVNLEELKARRAEWLRRGLLTTVPVPTLFGTMRKPA